jgi:hypothetical protein
MNEMDPEHDGDIENIGPKAMLTQTAGTELRAFSFT